VKIIYKGIFKDYEQLPLGELPPDAVKFKEAESFQKLSVVSLIFIIPALFLVAIIVMLSGLLHGGITIGGGLFIPLIAFSIGLLTIIPHEILHAVCFGKGAEIEVFMSLKHFNAFVVCTKPITKMRFIMLSLLPNLAFGWLPLIIWAILPYSGIYSDVLLYASVFGVLLGIGDYTNVYNAIRQMPKGSMQQLSGFNSYWFMP
jgi:hypothetical protein